MMHYAEISVSTVAGVAFVIGGLVWHGITSVFKKKKK
jgi:hypothetical protein